MKSLKIALFALVFCLLPLMGMARPVAAQWGSLLDVTYRFSWYPREDIRQLLAEKAVEYGQSLEGYRDQLRRELAIGMGPGGDIEVKRAAEGLQWRKYYHLSLAEFCLFLVSDDEQALHNARSVMGVLEGRAQQADVAFWQHLYGAYGQILSRDADGFNAAVYDLWQKVILPLEVDDLRMDRDLEKAGFVRSLPYLYENLAHLIIRRAIVEEQIEGLSPLGVIVLSMRDRLSVENGYRTVVEATVERMRGLNSDNYNLNFAVAFLEAIASRNAFEGEQNPELLVERYQRAESFYRLAWDWANTTKGRAAVLSQHMGFSTYITRRLSNPEDPLNQIAFFATLPAMADRQMDQAIALYTELSDPRIRTGGYVQAGFYEQTNYLSAMHRLWDSTAKLGIMLSGYHKGSRETTVHGQAFPAESPLVKYLTLFENHAQKDVEIVPDNAYFLAAFAAGELADLYRRLGNYSANALVGELAFAYQLQAIEIFPIDIVGILQLAYQASQDGRVEDYFHYTGTIGRALEGLAVASLGSEPRQGAHAVFVGHLFRDIPQVLRNAYALLNSIQHTDGTEEGMYRKVLAMNRILLTLENKVSSDFLAGILAALGQADFSEGVIALDPQIGQELSADDFARLQGILREVSTYEYDRLRNELYASLTSPMHKLLRNLYYGKPYDGHQYSRLLRKPYFR